MTELHIAALKTTGSPPPLYRRVCSCGFTSPWTLSIRETEFAIADHWKAEGVNVEAPGTTPKKLKTS